MISKNLDFRTKSTKYLIDLKTQCDDKYYNTGETSELDDWTYDLLKEMVEERESKYKQQIGAPVAKATDRVKLPYFLGSLDKISVQNESEYEKKGNQLTTWIANNKSVNYISSDKLDGVSCMYVCKSRKVQLFTRGNGTVGTDISYLAPYIRNIPVTFNDEVVRGELIIERKVYQRKYTSRYANARNMVSGILGLKTLSDAVNDIHFVAYTDMLRVSGSYSKALIRLKAIGFETVSYSSFNITPTIVECARILRERKTASLYDVDGLVLQPDKCFEPNTSGNPYWAVAFKLRMSDNDYETIVESVEWNVSKWGCLKPRVRIRPVQMADVRVEYTTGFNAKYISDFGIGKGAVIRLTRSGDVIPYITAVIKKVKPEMPSTPCKWNETRVDLVATASADTATMEIKRISDFFAKVGVKHVAVKSVTVMFKNGYDTICKILRMTLSEFEGLPGFGEKKAKLIFTNLKKGTQHLSQAVVLGAAGVFGTGMNVKKTTTLLTAIPDLLTKNNTQLKQEIMDVPGFSSKSADKLLHHMEVAKAFITELTSVIKIEPIYHLTKRSNAWNIAFSGFRDKELEMHIIAAGGSVCGSVTKNTTHLIVKTDNNSGKIQKARSIGIPVLTKELFLKK